MAYKFAWVTDPHLNFLDRYRRQEFYETLFPYNGVLITGDIAEADSVCNIIREMYLEIKKPIYFVLGNHDFYKGDVSSVKANINALCAESELKGNVIYLTESPCYVRPNNESVIIGVDGWADAREGDFHSEKVRLNDSVYIKDLKFAQHLGGHKGLGQIMAELSDKDTDALDYMIEDIMMQLPDTKNITILTHVPPFRETCLYDGKISGKDFLPFFCNKRLGEMLTCKAILFPDVQFHVFAGHTHGESKPYYPRENLRVEVGGAEYRYPNIAGEIEYE